MDTCKTCCRDAHILEPMSSRGIPTIVGEHAMATGFDGWDSDNFEPLNLRNQLSLWNTTPSVVGSFQWNFRIDLASNSSRRYLEWSLVDMIDRELLPPSMVFDTDRSSVCPDLADKVADQCPSFDNRTVYFNTACEWIALPAQNSSRRFLGP